MRPSLPPLLTCLLAALPALLSAGCSPATPSAHAAEPASRNVPFPYAETDVADLQARMSAGELDSTTLTQAYLQRIAALDRAGPRLRAVIELNPDALREAGERDRERRDGHLRGPLHGIPVLLKDNINAAPMTTSAGSLALQGFRPADAYLVRRLREAGAVVLGKTNLSEWANFRSTRSSSGWSSRGGQTKNAYALDRNPCGSSAGTGTAISASLATLGIGTETDGSIICPASVAGLVGLKPTVGLVSRNGIIPISITQDTAGPMTRTVSDAALLLGAIAAVDEADPAGHAAAGNVPADYTAFLKTDALKGKRFGLLRDAMGWHPGVDATLDKAVAAIKAAGGDVVDVKIATYNKWDPAEFDVLLYEFKDGLNRYLKNSGSKHASLEALIAWNKANADKAMPFFDQEIFEKAQAKGALTDAAYLKARADARRLAGPEGLVAALDKNKLDALITPSMSPAWITDHVLGDHFVGAGYGIAAVAGTPSITVPMGDIDGLPVGITFLGRAWSEPELMGYAYAYEQASHARKPPKFLPTVK
jgi:amidase